MIDNRQPAWLVIRCGSSRTLILAAELADRGAWSPAWKRKRRMPKSDQSRLITEACLPSFVFIPAANADDLPEIPRTPFTFMRHKDGALVRVHETELEPLRKIADNPTASPAIMPSVGTVMRFIAGPFEGLRGIVSGSAGRWVRIKIDGFGQPLQVPPALLEVMG